MPSAYTLEQLTPDVFVYVHPKGPWGVNNSGLICDGSRGSVLVDTLFTTALTRDMIAAMGQATQAVHNIETVVNTHANGDHWWGNALFKDADIIASDTAKAEMPLVTPQIMNKLLKVATFGSKIGSGRYPLAKILHGLGLTKLGALVGAAPYLLDIFGGFDFSDCETVLPNRTFSGSTTVSVGQKQIQLIEVGAAHTKGDVMVFVPEDGVLFAGDLLFIGGHPIMWEGPVANWIAACDQMIALEPKHVVPGHGPLTDADGIRQHKHYLERIAEQAKKQFDAAVPLRVAAKEIDLGPFVSLSEPERLIVNLETLYMEFGGKPPRKSTVPCFEMMAEYLRERQIPG